MNIIVIGGTGHIGTFLIPRLVQAGHQVTVVSRQRKIPYQGHDAWQQVRLITMDRPQMEQEGTFGRAIADLSPEVIIDLICFRPESAYELVSALRGDLSHFIHCGTMWVHGHKVQIPSEEWHVRRPLGEYGLLKAEIERYLLDEAGKLFPVTVLHPGHIVGPGWTPVNPVGNFDASVFTKLATGEELLFPTLGMETLHHVHADDVALAFMQVLANGRSAAGESFHVLSENAITCRGYAEEVAAWYGRQAAWRFVSWDEFRHAVPDEDAQSTWDHLSHSSVGSIEKAKRLLNYAPRYTSLQAIKQAIASLPSHLPFPGVTSIL